MIDKGYKTGMFSTMLAKHDDILDKYRKMFNKDKEKEIPSYGRETHFNTVANINPFSTDNPLNFNNNTITNKNEIEDRIDHILGKLNFAYQEKQAQQQKEQTAFKINTGGLDIESIKNKYLNNGPPNFKEKYAPVNNFTNYNLNPIQFNQFNQPPQLNTKDEIERIKAKYLSNSNPLQNIALPKKENPFTNFNLNTEHRDVMNYINNLKNEPEPNKYSNEPNAEDIGKNLNINDLNINNIAKQNENVQNKIVLNYTNENEQVNTKQSIPDRYEGVDKQRNKDDLLISKASVFDSQVQSSLLKSLSYTYSQSDKGEVVQGAEGEHEEYPQNQITEEVNEESNYDDIMPIIERVSRLKELDAKYIVNNVIEGVNEKLLENEKEEKHTKKEEVEEEEEEQKEEEQKEDEKYSYLAVPKLLSKQTSQKSLKGRPTIIRSKLLSFEEFLSKK